MRRHMGQEVASCSSSPVRSVAAHQIDASPPTMSRREAEMMAFASAWTLRQSSYRSPRGHLHALRGCNSPCPRSWPAPARRAVVAGGDDLVVFHDDGAVVQNHSFLMCVSFLSHYSLSLLGMVLDYSISYFSKLSIVFLYFFFLSAIKNDFKKGTGYKLLSRYSLLHILFFMRLQFFRYKAGNTYHPPRSTGHAYLFL